MRQDSLKAAALVLLGAEIVAAGLAATAPGVVSAQEAGAVGVQRGETILAAGSYWRVFAMRAPGVIPLELLREVKPDATEPGVIDAWRTTSPPPPSNWMDPDFDDRDWLRLEGPFSGGYVGWADQYDRLGRTLICLRGKFTVSDVQRVKRLTLSAQYQGGVVVYLNGNEVFRGHLPKGEVHHKPQAEPYPRDAYVDAQGKVIPQPYTVAQRLKEGDRDLEGRLAQRADRTIRGLSLPAGALRKGLNVLALELHRSAFRPEIITADGKRASWPHIGLASLRLTAEAAPGAILPSVARPQGFQVWNQDPNQIFGVAEYGDPNEPLRPIRLVGARNGYYSGQVVVGSPAAIEGLRAVPSDLRLAEGAQTIPARNVRVRYSRLTNLGMVALGPGCRAPAFAVLEDDCPDAVAPAAPRSDPRDRRRLDLPADITPAAVQPIWVTVHIPEDAPAGDYNGALAVCAAGLPETKVPITLQVVDWALPDARDCRAVVGIYQSPESLAVHYNVPMWSDKHVELLDRSWQLMGYLGNNLLVVPLVNRTQFGNDEGMIAWVKQDDGTYTFDFSAYDKYVFLAMKHCKIRIVSYQVNLASGWGAAEPDKPVHVTVVDPQTGERGTMRLPPYGSAEAKRLWRPLIDALRERHRRFGLDGDTIIALGIAQDGGIHKVIVDHFSEVFPEAGWHYGAHNRPYGWRRKVYTYSEYLYVSGIPSPAKERRCGWQNTPLVLMSQRAFDQYQTPIVVRTMVERALLLGDNGPGRMCLDYWPVKGSREGNHGYSLFSRWPESSASQRTPHLRLLSLPGKTGATATVKTEAFREGRQEAEARILIEEALLSNTIGGALAERCRRLLDERVSLCQAAHQMPWANRRTVWVACGGGWRPLSERLYRLAAEVARVRKTGRRV